MKTSTRTPNFRVLVIAFLLCPVAWGQPSADPIPAPPLEPEDLPPETAPADFPEGRNPGSPSSLQPASPTTGSEKPDELPAADSSPGRDVLEACKRAIQQAHAVTFRAKTFATDSLKSMSPETQADVRMLRPVGTSNWVVRSTGSGSAKGGGTPVQFDVSWLSVTTEFVDHDAKKVIEKRSRDARGPFYQVAAGTKPDDLIATNPLSKPLAATEITLEERSNVGGVECDVVRISTGASGRNVSKWSIGVEDHFPRKIEKIVASSAFSGSIVTEFSGVVVSPDAATIRPELMRVAVPDGYTQDRPPVPPPPVLQPPSGDTPKDGGFDGKAIPVPGDTSPSGTPEFVEPIDLASGPAPTPSATDIPAAVTLPQALPDFDLADSSGNRTSRSTLSGKPVVLVFFGAWSLPARQGLPAIEAAIRPHATSHPAFGVSVRDKALANAEGVARDAGFTPAVLGSGDALANALAITVFPAVIIANTDGRIVHRFEGIRNAEDAAPIVAALAAASEPADGAPPSTK